MDNRFYNYAYLDPSKPFNLKLERFNIILEFEPFYVGKGTGKRYKQHVYCNSGKFMNCKIKSLRDKNIKPLIIKVVDNITEDQALYNEAYLISVIGRRDLNRGPLCNLDNGGKSKGGYIMKEETKQKLRLINIGKKLSEEHKIKIGLANKGKPISQATKDGKEKWLACRIKKEKPVKINKRKIYRPIVMLDLNNNIIDTYKSFIEASEKTGIKKYTIRRQCETLGKCRYKPFKFRYND